MNKSVDTPVYDPKGEKMDSITEKTINGKASDKELLSLIKIVSPHLIEEGHIRNLDMFRRASELGYFKLSKQLRNYIAGKRILDIGCDCKKSLS